MSLYDIEAALGGAANCDPRDSACVMCNEQKANAAEDAMISSSCIAPGTPVGFSCDTSPAALNQYLSNVPQALAVTVGVSTVTERPAGGVTVTPPACGSEPARVDAASNRAWGTWARCMGLLAALPPPPPLNQVVNPSPGTQTTTSGSNTVSPGSVTNQANGTITTSGLVSTVQGYIRDLSSGTDIIAGIPNWVLLGGIAVAAVVIVKGGKR